MPQADEQQQTLDLRVAAITAHTPLVREFVLERPDGGALPGFAAGAHLRVLIKDGGAERWNAYSLINTDATVRATDAPARYRVAVRREDGGRGGSQWMHDVVAEGDLLTVTAPKNDFPLHADEGGEAAVLIAGGIGVTPLLSMAAALRANGRDFTFHYCGRESGQLAFVDEAQALAGPHTALHYDNDPACALDLDGLLGALTPGQPLYVCGPKGMIHAVLDKATARGWPRERVHFELFEDAHAEAGDKPFEVVLAQSGKTLTVPADKTLMDVLIEAGEDPLYDCLRGECGVCQVDVLEGEIDHRDMCLTDDEKASGTVMQACISRAKGDRLVLDL